MATRIYVGNLPYSADDQQLSQLFEAFGEVVESSVVIDRSTTQSKGFGFVEMASAGDAATAIQRFNDTELKGRNIRVNEAKPRESRPSGGGRGGSDDTITVGRRRKQYNRSGRLYCFRPRPAHPHPAG